MTVVVLFAKWPCMEWLEIKIWLISTTGLDRDALHIYCALVIQLFCALFFRRRLGSIWPWIAVLIIATINEYLDYQRVGTSEASILLFQAEAYRDMWNTMLLPTILTLIARFWPWWMVRKPEEKKTSRFDKLWSEPGR